MTASIGTLAKGIATIAMSGEYSTDGNTSGVLADAFLQKSHYTLKAPFRKIVKLLAASPIRSEERKSESASLFVPRDNAGYLMITCPKWQRPNRLEAMGLSGGYTKRLVRQVTRQCDLKSIARLSR